MICAKWSILLLINAGLMFTLVKWKRSVYKQTLQQRNGNKLNGIRITAACVFVYTFTQLPNLVFGTLVIGEHCPINITAIRYNSFVASREPYKTFHFNRRTEDMVDTIVTILQLCNYTLNVFVYCLSRKYRHRVQNFLSKLLIAVKVFC